MNDDLADWIAGRLEAGRAEEVRRAVAADPGLGAEAAVIRAVAAGQPPVAEGLDVRIAAAVLKDRRGQGRAESTLPGGGRGAAPSRYIRMPQWALVAAAAALVLALGSWGLMDRTRIDAGAPMESLVGALLGPHTPWVADDGTVGGAPILGDLSEEVLANLLEEMGG